MPKMQSPLATVVVLTYNGATYLDELLNAVLAQEVEGLVDVLVIDSGSTDKTLEIVSRFPSVRLHQIPNSEFGHGRTRNLGARLSLGEYTAFLTHDATPADSRWLAYLLQPMQEDSRIGGVLGRQIPRPQCIPLMKYEIEGVFASQGAPLGTTTYRASPSDGEGERRHKGFYSDVNSASRTALLRDSVQYRDVDYAEDQLFGLDLLAAGYLKAYAGQAAVIHSNDLTFREFGKRAFDETLGLRSVGLGGGAIPRRFALKRAVASSLADAVRIARDPALGRKSKLRWLIVNPFYQLRKWKGIRLALSTPLDTGHGTSKHSLEGSRKRPA